MEIGRKDCIGDRWHSRSWVGYLPLNEETGIWEFLFVQFLWVACELWVGVDGYIQR